MKREDEEAFLRFIGDKDISEIMALVMRSGNRYNRRILNFFEWFCKWMPVFVMCFHAYGVVEFSQHPREMFVPISENTACYLFIYFMLYVLPMVIILASRFFHLCWRYRIPFFYFIGVNAIHIGNMSIFTTNEMVNNHFCLFVMTAIFYGYGFFELFLGSQLGRRICK